ncbi:MAG: Ger(x)C family spore germination protein [Oscillospiraceae bacterium]|nr:Ger(x)C family spore germination protein [Oscillospiraceae bacterium]
MKIKLLFLSLILPLLTGCFNYQEIEDGVTVSAITIDFGDESKYRVGIEIIKTGDNSQTETQVLSGEGESIHSALYKMIGMLNNNIYLGHCESVILSKEVAESGINDILEYFMRNNEFRKNMIIFVSKTENASEILQGINVKSQIVGYEINNSVDADNKHQSNTVYSPLYKVTNAILSEKGAALVSVIEIDKSDDESRLKLNGCGYFYRDKLAGFLTAEETQILNIIRNDANEVRLTLNKMGITIDNASTSLKKQENKIVLRTKARIEIFETEGKKITDKSNLDNIKEELYKRTEELIEKMQKNKQIDVFKVATLFDKKGESSHQYFNSLEIKPEIELKLKGSGTINEE